MYFHHISNSSTLSMCQWSMHSAQWSKLRYVASVVLTSQLSQLESDLRTRTRPSPCIWRLLATLARTHHRTGYNIKTITQAHTSLTPISHGPALCPSFVSIFSFSFPLLLLCCIFWSMVKFCTKLSSIRKPKWWQKDIAKHQMNCWLEWMVHSCDLALRFWS